MPAFKGPHIAVPQSSFHIPWTSMTGSDISMPDVVPPTPTLDTSNSESSDADASIHINGFSDIAEGIEIGESTGVNFLKPSPPFEDGGLEFISHPPRSPRRKALLIGIKYDGVTAPVEGAHNDVEAMMNFLIDHYGWSEADISILKDDEDPTTLRPTRENIICGMQELVMDARAGDRLFLHFSGHGGQIIDTDGDEADGLDEVIFSCDKLPIVDDDLHDVLVKPLPANCKLRALFDCCSSGTSLDLPVIESSVPMKQSLLVPWDSTGDKIISSTSGDGSMLDLRHQYAHPFATPDSPPTPELISSAVTASRPSFRKKYTLGDVIMWSSCQDSERSYEVVAKTTDSENGTAMKGAMTHAFIECLKERKDQTYRSLLDALGETLTLWGCPQKPVMSSAHRVNMKDTVSL